MKHLESERIITMKGWSPFEVETTTENGTWFTWSPLLDSIPYRVIGLRICCSKLTLVSAKIGGGMNLFQPIQASGGSISIQDAERKIPARTVVLDTHHRTIDLEPGDWIIEPFFQHPLLLKPNSITIETARGVLYPAVPRVFARFIVPDGQVRQVSLDQDRRS